MAQPERRSRKRGRSPAARRPPAAGPTGRAAAPGPTQRAAAPGPTGGPAAAGPAQRAPAPGPAQQPRSNQWFAAPTGEELTRSQRRDAEARASLTPLEPGEHPTVIVISTVVALILALSNLIAYLAGATIGGRHPAGGGILLFSAVMLACAVGLWRMWYGAVLGFMALLAIVAAIFALLLIEASNLLGLVVALAVITGAGWLFFKLVRVLSRIQMPRRPER